MRFFWRWLALFAYRRWAGPSYREPVGVCPVAVTRRLNVRPMSRESGGLEIGTTARLTVISSVASAVMRAKRNRGIKC